MGELLPAEAQQQPMKPTRTRDLEPYDWAEVLRSSRQEGHGMVARVLSDFRSGANRFDRPGELLLVCLDANSVAAVCGLNIEEEPCFGKAARIRRLYVRPSHRGEGLARSLIDAVVASATGQYDVLTVNVGTLPARDFYEHLGFAGVDHPRITHVMELA